jgi:hypothetical protein
MQPKQLYRSPLNSLPFEVRANGLWMRLSSRIERSPESQMTKGQMLPHIWRLLKDKFEMVGQWHFTGKISYKEDELAEWASLCGAISGLWFSSGYWTMIPAVDADMITSPVINEMPWTYLRRRTLRLASEGLLWVCQSLCGAHKITWDLVTSLTDICHNIYPLTSYNECSTIASLTVFDGLSQWPSPLLVQAADWFLPRWFRVTN